MRFSIIIPLYNKAQYIKDTISSVLCQTFGDYEIIVVNDSSADNSVELVESFSDFRVKLFTKPNGGVSAARNYGIKKSSGEIVCFLDADDLWKPTYLEVLDKHVSKYQSISFFCGAFERFQDNPANIIGIKDLMALNSSSEYVTDYINASIKTFGSIALTSCVAVRRKLLDTMDSWFDESICIGEDNDMWVRCCLRTQVLYNNIPLMSYRCFAEGGLTKTHYKFNNAVNYQKWYSYSIESKMHYYATLMAYTRARKFYDEKNYEDSIESLKQASGSTLIFRKILLYLLCNIGLLKQKLC